MKHEMREASVSEVFPVYSEVMSASNEPYCRLCRYKFDWGDSAIDHFVNKHIQICYELADFKKFVDIVMENFIGSKLDEHKFAYINSHDINNRINYHNDRIL